MKLSRTNGVWSTNNGKFQTSHKATAAKIVLPEFSMNQEILETNRYVNTNTSQKYKAIFGMDFLIANGIDFINSKKMIEWHGIRVPMRGNTPENECEAQDKSKLADNKYMKMTGE